MVVVGAVVIDVVGAGAAVVDVVTATAWPITRLPDAHAGSTAATAAATQSTSGRRRQAKAEAA